MREIASAVFVVILFVLGLKMELLPWRLVDADEYRSLVRAVHQTRAEPPRLGSHFARDPDYRSALERTTFAGRPEKVKDRDQ